MRATPWQMCWEIEGRIWGSARLERMMMWALFGWEKSSWMTCWHDAERRLGVLVVPFPGATVFVVVVVVDILNCF